MIPILLGLAVVGYLLSRSATVDPTPGQSPEEIAAAAKARIEAERRQQEEQSMRDTQKTLETLGQVGGVLGGVLTPLIPVIKTAIVGAGGAGSAGAGAGVAAKVAADAAAAAKAAADAGKAVADAAKSASSGFANLGFAIYGGALAAYVIAMSILSAVCERRSEWVASMRELYEQFWPVHTMENFIAQDWLTQNKIYFEVESFKDDRLTIPLQVRGYQTIGSRNRIVPALGSKDREGNLFDAKAWLKLQLLARSAALAYTKSRLEAGDRVYRYFYPNAKFNSETRLDVDALANFPLCGGETIAEPDPEKIYLDPSAPELMSARASIARAPKGDKNLNVIMMLKGRFAALGTLRKNPTIYLEADAKVKRGELFDLIFGDIQGITKDWNNDLLCFPQETFGLPAVPHPLAGLAIPNQVMPPNRLGNWDGYISLAEVMAGRGGVTGALSGAGLG